jgi:hypothetical protein
LIDVLVCTNLVNYTVAVNGVRPGRERRALLLYEGWRFDPRPIDGTWQRPIRRSTMRWAWLLHWLGLLHTLYVPHQRLHRPLNKLRLRVDRLAYLDDGLDTHREAPLNFDRHDGTRRRPYHTFTEFTRLPAWLDAYDVERVCSLTNLARASSQPPLDLEGVEHVFVESPGLQIGEVIRALSLDRDRVLVVRHPVPHKQGDVPRDCRDVAGRQFNLEATLLACTGKRFYVGESMVLIFAQACGVTQRNEVWAQLSGAQRNDLVGLQWEAADTAAAAIGLMRLSAVRDER